jgi:hypothetical protein
MKYIPFLVTMLTIMPAVAYAQGLQGFFINIVRFISNAVIPFLLGVAFLFFVINVFRFFIVGATNDESQKKAKNLATYSILAFVTIVVFWGVVNLLSSSLGIAANKRDIPTSDYFRVGPGQKSELCDSGKPLNEEGNRCKENWADVELVVPPFDINELPIQVVPPIEAGR